jgi:hypothetical protein
MATEPAWIIGREGRRWSAEQVRERAELLPEKLEVASGRLCWSDDERRHLLAMLLEQLGADVAVRMGDAAVWRDAVAALNGEP